MRSKSADATVIFRVDGTSGRGRAKNLGAELGKLDGVRAIEFNYILDTVLIKYDGKKRTLDFIRNTLFSQSGSTAASFS